VRSARATWPLTGRDSELVSIARAREDRACHGVIVYAAAGVGKSRLAREAMAAAQRAGALGYWVQATSSAAAVPLGALAGLMPDEVRSDEPLELMRRSADALQRQANGRAVVLSVDDAHLLDPVSAALVLHLAGSANVFVLATVRSGEPCPDAIVALWKDGGARRIELARLDNHAVGRLVQAALQGPLEQAALQWVIQRSQGNPLYLRELVLGGLADGTLELNRGLWRMSGRPTVSPTLVELIKRRMSALSAAQRAPIELLALGEPLRVQEIASLTEYESVADAETLGLLTVSGSGQVSEVRLAHPLYGEVVRRGLPVLRARTLHLRLAEALQRRDPMTPDDALRVTRWLLDAGAPIKPDLVFIAARTAILAGDPDLGARLAELAVADGAGLPGTLLLARSHTLRQRHEDAEAVLAEAEEAAAHGPLAIEYLQQRLSGLFWGLKRNQELRDLLTRAQAWSTEPSWQRRLEPVRFGFVALIDHFEDGATVASEILADPELDPTSRRSIEAIQAMALFSAGQAKEAHTLVWHQRPSVPLEGYNDTLLLAACGYFALESGEHWADLEAYMAEVLRDGARTNDHEAAGHGAFYLASLRFLEGRFRDAARWLTEAELHFEHQDTFGSVLNIRVLELGIEYFTGNLPAVAVALDAVHEALAGREPLPNQRLYVERAEGWAACARSRTAGANRLIRAARRDTEGAAHLAALVYEALRAGAPAITVAKDLRQLAPRCDASLVTAYAAHAEALTARDGSALLEAAEMMASIGALRYGMEAAVHAAAAFLAAGRGDSARRAVTRARELFAPGQGATFPQVDGLDAAATELTRREAQVAALVTHGLSNAQIADQLVLSVRTVETHVYRAMHKRAVSDRHDL
jgi:DNA-binding NarL/FixJ family response regulator